MNRILKPDTRLEDLRFSSGPCAKPPTWKLKELSDATLGRSHRAQVGREKLRKAIEETH
jgi:phosphoserine aminotransferase